MTSILVDSATRALLAASDSVAGIAFLNKALPDTYHVSHADRPNYTESGFVKSLVPAEFPRWSWRRRDRTFQETRPHLVTEALIARSALAIAKLRAFLMVTQHLNTARNRLVTGLQFQESVYLVKFIEATRFRAASYAEDRILEFPYVLQYAEFAGIPLRQAADDIILKAEFDQHFLLNTEGLRLKYLKLIREAASPGDLAGIGEACRRECFENTMV